MCVVHQTPMQHGYQSHVHAHVHVFACTENAMSSARHQLLLPVILVWKQALSIGTINMLNRKEDGE